MQLARFPFNAQQVKVADTMATQQQALWIIISCFVSSQIAKAQINSTNMTETTSQPLISNNTTIYLETTSIKTTNEQLEDQSLFVQSNWLLFVLIGCGCMLLCVCVTVILCKRNKNESNEDHNLETHHKAVSTKEDDLEMTKLQNSTQQQQENGDALHVESPLINPFDDDDNRRARMSTVGKDDANPFLVDGALEIEDEEVTDMGPSTVEQKKNWIAFDED